MTSPHLPYAAEVQAAIAETGETPRDYMLRVMRDETVDHARRDAMAKAVAPFVTRSWRRLQRPMRLGDMRTT
jgi:hypothetical protein